MPKKTNLPLQRDDDSEEMTKAIEFALSYNMVLTRPSPHQIKSGSVSYYPGTGSIVIDGEGKKITGGLAALRKIMENRRGMLRFRVKPNEFAGLDLE